MLTPGAMGSLGLRWDVGAFEGYKAGSAETPRVFPAYPPAPTGVPGGSVQGGILGEQEPQPLVKELSRRRLPCSQTKLFPTPRGGAAAGHFRELTAPMQ